MANIIEILVKLLGIVGTGITLIAIVKWGRGAVRWVRMRTVDRFKRWVDTPRPDPDMQAEVAALRNEVEMLRERLTRHEIEQYSHGILNQNDLASMMTT